MDYGFDVYHHEDGATLGIAKSDNDLVVVKIKADGTFVTERHPYTAIAQTVAKLARRGFKQAKRVMYLHITYDADGQAKSASFEKNHPDLLSSQFGELVLFVNKPKNLGEEVFAQWREQLEKLSPRWKYDNAWLIKQEKATSCLAAFDGHPVTVLLVAQYAFSAGLPICSAVSGVPKQPPDIDPAAWVNFLKEAEFTERQIHSCTQDLGLTVHQVIEKTMQSEAPVEQTPTGDDDWMQTMLKAMI